MPGLVEQQIYRLPDTNSGTLRDSSNRKTLVKRREGYEYKDLAKVADNLGLDQTSDLQTPKAIWHMYRKGNLAIPNFEAPDTTASISLALYRVPETRWKGAPDTTSNAVLRLSGNYQSRSEFYEDIEALTKYYTERPMVKGLPNRFHSLATYVFTGLAVGFGSGMAYDYATSGQLIAGATLVGEVAGPIVGALVYPAIEKYASSHVSNMAKYRADDSASYALKAVDDHITKVSIQKELYSALGDIKMNPTPEQFLSDIWPQLPSRLVDKRKSEMEYAKNPGEKEKAMPIDAIDRMVHIAEMFRAA